VYVVTPGLRLAGSRRGLRVLKGEELLAEHAWSTLSEIVVLGGHCISANTFQQALRHRVPLAMYTRNGVPLGVVLPDRVRTPSPMTRRHWQWHQGPATPTGAEAAAPRRDHLLQPARSLVEAKIHNQRLLSRYQPGDNDALRQRLQQLAGAAGRAESVARLRGVEGQAAHAYFTRWRNWLPRELDFKVRSGRGAADPVNAVLNLLYTNLFRLCWLGIVNHGLDPYLGVLHEGNDRYAALAADLQEPFRFLCDRLVLELFHRNILQATDFRYAEKAPLTVRIQADAMKRILTEWEGRLEAKVRIDGVALSYRSHILAQVQRFAELVRGKRADLAAFRLEW
jgi:CRISPR-associated endonuclease Cas1